MRDDTRRALRTSRLRVVFCLFLAVALAAACAKKLPPDADGDRGQAREIALGGEELDSLDCSVGDCADWYRVRVEEKGTLTLRGQTREPGNPSMFFTLNLENGFGDPIERLVNIRGDGQSVVRELDSGIYLIGVESAAPGITLYEISTRFELARAPSRSEPDPVPVAAPKPPKPAFDRVQAEVLEVEGSMAAPTAVLIDLGSTRGVYEGLVGELREADSLVGEVRISDVYKEGSRARVTAPLRRPITPNVKAVLLFPKAEPEETMGSGSSAGGDGDYDESMTGDDEFTPYLD